MGNDTKKDMENVPKNDMETVMKTVMEKHDKKDTESPLFLGKVIGGPKQLFREEVLEVQAELCRKRKCQTK